jgi:hypothetical protein
MGLYKYKLKELDLGDKDLNKGVRTTVIDANPEQNSTSWKVEYNIDMGAPILKLNEVIEVLNGLIKHNRKDEHLRTLLDYTRRLRNSYRAHIRADYPEIYDGIKRKKEYMKEEIEEIDEESTSAGAGAYSTPFAFNKNKKADGAPLKYYYRLGFQKVPAKVKGSGLEVKHLWNEENV